MSGERRCPNVSPPKTPFWQMNPVQRLAASMERVLELREHFIGKGAKVSFAPPTLTVETPANNYIINVADDEPRAIVMQVIYEIFPGDVDRAAWACYNATSLSKMAKAKAVSEKDGYRLHFCAEVWADDLTAFTDVAGLYMAAIEDVRSCYLTMMAQAIEVGELSWSTQPNPRA